jgi:4-hydroxy-2-oxoheptanedioate aldolase
MSRMFDRFANGQLATGTITLNHGLELVEVLGYSGFDFICLDMMVTSLDWSEVAAMVLAAKRYDVTPWVRLSAYPWGEGEMDSGLPAQVMRAFGLGAECVLASVNTAQQVKQLMHPIANSHRRFYIRQGGEGRTEVQRRLDAAEPELRVVPIIESLAAIKHVDEILEVPGLRMVYLGMGDLTKALGHPGDDRHPEVGKGIRKIVEQAESHGIVVSAVTLGYKHGVDLMDQITDGVESLWQLGVRGVLFPRPTMIVQYFYENTLERVRNRLQAAYP